MISHEFRFIFIHIPRTGGSSIEHALAGRDWWEIDGTTKHLTASQARIIYADYWDDYFKFAFVRNPAERMLSCMKFGGVFTIGCQPGCTFADFLRGYQRRFGAPVTQEFDHRFHPTYRSKLAMPHAVYRNMLDEDIDFIGKFETLNDDFRTLAQKLELPEQSLGHHEPSKFMPKSDAFTQEEN